MIWFQYQPFKVTRKYHKISRNFSKTEISAFQQHAFDIQYYYIIPRIILVGIPLLCELANFLRLSFLLNVITSMKLTKLTETLNSYQYNFFVHDIRCEFSLIFQVCKNILNTIMIQFCLVFIAQFSNSLNIMWLQNISNLNVSADVQCG